MNQWRDFIKNEGHWLKWVLVIGAALLAVGVVSAASPSYNFMLFQSPLTATPDSPLPSPTPDQRVITVYAQVMRREDDGLWAYYDGLDLYSSAHWIGPQGTNARLSCSIDRFIDVQVPQGASVLEVRMFKVKQNTTTGGWSVDWYAEAAGYSEPFVEPMGEFTRTLTTRFVHQEAFGTYYDGKRYVLGVDLTPLIRDVIGRLDWSYGSALTIFGCAVDDGSGRRMRWRAYDRHYDDTSWLMIKFSLDPQDEGATQIVTPIPTDRPPFGPTQVATFYPNDTKTPAPPTHTPTPTVVPPTPTDTPTPTATATPLPPCVDLITDAEWMDIARFILTNDFDMALAWTEVKRSQMPHCYAIE